MIPVKTIRRQQRVVSIRRKKKKRRIKRKTKRLTKLRINKDLLEASICRDLFYEFVKRFWGEIVGKKFQDNWHISVICRELQTVAERIFRDEPKIYDLIINVPPGTTKSTICTRMFPVWCWLRDASFSCISISHAYKLAEKLSRDSRKLIRSPKFKRLFPEIKISVDQDTKALFETAEGGMRLSAGMDTGVTGFHADAIVIDDPLNPQEAASEAELANCAEVIKDTLPQRVKDPDKAVIILIMQRIHQADPTQLLLDLAKKEGGTPVRHLRFPAEITSPKEVKPRKYAKHYKNGLLDPVRLKRKILNRKRAGMTAPGYAGQYLQTPTPRGGAMFHTSEIKLVDVLPHEIQRKVRYWDKAGSKRTGSGNAANRRSHTVGALIGRLKDGRFIVMDIVRGQWEAFEREKIIKQTARTDGRSVLVVVEQEPGSGGKESAQNTIRNLAGFRVKADRPTGDKQSRADPFAVQVNAGNVMVLNRTWTSEWMEEHRYFPNSQSKDQVDASSGAFAILTGRRGGGAFFRKSA